MSLLVIVALAIAGALAFVNGANDVSRGVATLVGAGVASYRRALLWGAAWTALGTLAAAWLGQALLTTFGHGLLAEGTQATLAAALATLLGATTWVALATRYALPVSTTHAIVGALVGATILAHGVAGVRWDTLGPRVFLPLLLSPLASAALALVLARMGRRSAPPADCLCLDVASPMPLPASSAGTAFSAAPDTTASFPIRVFVAPTSECAPGPRHEATSTSGSRLALTSRHLHWFGAGLTSFARGLNDGPKIAALALALGALGHVAASPGLVFVVVAAAMTAGGLLAGRRVTETLATKVTPMTDTEGTRANLVTASLVASGAAFGLPMSTTHVAGGVLFGTGYARGTLDRRVLREILLAWLITLPGTALLAALWYGLFAPHLAP